MLSNFFPYLYAVATIVLLIQAARVMSRGVFFNNLTHGQKRLKNKLEDDRTGRVTIHPELLNKEGNITDEDLLTVRFSRDIDPPQSAEKSAD